MLSVIFQSCIFRSCIFSRPVKTTAGQTAVDRMTDRDDVVASVEERRGIIVVQVAGVEGRGQGSHVVLRPLPHVASHVAEPQAVGRVRVDRLSITHHVTGF